MLQHSRLSKSHSNVKYIFSFNKMKDAQNQSSLQFLLYLQFCLMKNPWSKTRENKIALIDCVDTVLHRRRKKMMYIAIVFASAVPCSREVLGADLSQRYFLGTFRKQHPFRIVHRMRCRCHSLGLLHSSCFCSLVRRFGGHLTSIQ